jgi:hypothetical protein
MPGATMTVPATCYVWNASAGKALLEMFGPVEVGGAANESGPLAA